MSVEADHDLSRAEHHGRGPRAGRRWCLRVVGCSSALALAWIAGCAHGDARPPKPTTAAAEPARDPAPGASAEEKHHVLEAQWTEVTVKARKQRGNGKAIVSAVKLVQPKIRIFHAAPPPDDAHAKDQGRPAADPSAVKGKGPSPEETIDLAALLYKITPLEVDHIDVLDGQVAFIDTSRKERPEIWMHDLELSVENLATRVHLTEGRPVLLTAHATVARSGTMSLFVTADPFETGLTFSGRAAIVGLQTAELYRFIEPATNLQAPEGTIDMFIEFDCRNGELTGGVKPVLKNVEIRPGDKNLWTRLKAWAGDLAVKIFSDRVDGRNAVVTVVPIKGTLNGPDVQLWPTIFGVMRNAFVEGLTSGYAHLPPPVAQKKDEAIKQ